MGVAGESRGASLRRGRRRRGKGKDGTSRLFSSEEPMGRRDRPRGDALRRARIAMDTRPGNVDSIAGIAGRGLNRGFGSVTRGARAGGDRFSRPLTSSVFITTTNTCLLPTLILLSFALTGWRNSSTTSYSLRSSPSLPAVALNVRRPSSSRLTRGCSGFGRSMVISSRSLRCAHSTVGVSLTASSGIACVSGAVPSRPIAIARSTPVRVPCRPRSRE